MTTFLLDGHPPHQRDPSRYPWGYFVDWSLGRGAARGFHWFATEAEALDGLCALDDELFPQPLADQPEGEANTLRWLLGSDPGMQTVPLERINALQVRATVRWMGHRDDLMSSHDRFAREIRHDFADHWEDPSHAVGCPGGMAAFFYRHLLAYAERFPETRYVSPFRLTAVGGGE